MSGKFDFYLSIAHDKGLCALVKRCKEKQFENLDKSDILAYRRQDYQIDVLVNNKEAAERKYAGIVIDHATIDEIMLILVKGEQK